MSQKEVIVLAWLATATLPASAQSTAGRMLGRVVDMTTGQPVPSAQVMISAGADSAGPYRGTFAGADGSFSFGDVADGEHTIRVESIGYRSASRVVRIDDAVDTAVRIELTPQPVQLGGVVVEGTRSTVLGGFYARRATHEGYYIDRSEIAKRAAHRPTDLMRRIPGLMVVCPGVSPRCTVRFRSAVPVLAGPDKGDCPVEIFVDGVPASPDFAVDDLRVEDIQAVEIYGHAATIPARFNRGRSSRCGVIVVWTRRQ